MKTKTYLLVAAALALSVVTIPAPASALKCLPLDTNHLVEEVRCQVFPIACAPGGIVAEVCVTAVRTLDGAFDEAAALEDYIHTLP